MPKEVLLIVDMSNDFVADEGPLTTGKPAQQIVPYIVELADSFIENGQPVFVSMDAHQPNDSHFYLWPEHNVIGTEGQQLYGELSEWYQTNKENDLVHYLPKTNYNAFFETGLAEKLRTLGVEEVHVTGVCTDICDFLTIAGADAEGFKTVIHRKGAATFTDLGDPMIEHMVRCFQTKVVE